MNEKCMKGLNKGKEEEFSGENIMSHNYTPPTNLELIDVSNEETLPTEKTAEVMKREAIRQELIQDLNYIAIKIRHMDIGTLDKYIAAREATINAMQVVVYDGIASNEIDKIVNIVGEPEARVALLIDLDFSLTEENANLPETVYSLK